MFASLLDLRRGLPLRASCVLARRLLQAAGVQAPVASRFTTIEVVYPPHRGTIGVRGSHEPLSWEHTTPPTRSDGDHHWFVIRIPDGETLELKLVRDSEDWAHGRNYSVHAGDHLLLQPAFDRTYCELLPPRTLAHGATTLTYQVLVPPSYGEQEAKRYPVIYAQDGQALWTTSPDPFGVWNLDETLNNLLDLAVIQEAIVVAIDTSENRLDRLGPVPDPDHGGGGGAAHLAAIIDGLKPAIDTDFRTMPEREHTCALGSSMGGLFSFFAAWSRPDVFGKAICLSSSFWWAGRHMIRAITEVPEPRPIIYLDSGAAMNPDEPTASAHDGFHHTRAMHRALDRIGFTPADLRRLTFPGHSHNASSWAARVAIPLQLLFPAAATRESVESPP